jgi:cytochrome c-type biogenesis protein CcmH/NrfG
MARDEIFLTAEELRLRKRKRRLIVFLLLLLVLLLVGGYFAARPASHMVKAWQARRHAQRAFALIDKEQWPEARAETVAAYQLRPSEPQALRAVARFLTRTRQPDALEFWSELRKIDKLTRDDLREEAAIALMASETTRAAESVRVLLERSDAGPADWLLAAQSAQQNNAPDEARKFAQKVLDDPRADEPNQLQAAILVLANTPRENTDPAVSEPAWARLRKISAGQTRTALDALVVLTQQALSSQRSEVRGQKSENGQNTQQPVAPKPGEGGSEMSDQQSLLDLAGALENHPLAKAQHKLLAVDLRIRADESQRDALIARAIDQWKNADAVSLATLATWLNGKAEYQKALDNIPLEKTLQSRDLFLQYLDSLAALERWTDVKQLLVSDRFPLDPVVQQMYLARCSVQLGEKAAAENNWRRAVEAAAGDVGKLMTLGEYAEKNGNIDIAEAAYTNAATAAPKLRIAQQGRLRIAQRKRDTRKLHSVLADMLVVWPNDAAVQNDEAYTRLLLLPATPKSGEGGPSQQSQVEGRKEKVENGPAIETQPPIASQEQKTDNQELRALEDRAQKLIERDPSSLPHRTLLALARLRQGRAEDALRVYENIQVAPTALTASALAVHAAVLEATGHHDDAGTEMEKIKSDQLLPEEQALVENAETLKR